MTQATSNGSMSRLKNYLNDYRPQLERAIAAIQVLETSDSESEEFAQALADLQVCATILEPYSEGLVEAIDQFTEAQTDND
jgi:ABC-type transporter Mla subunit MlaD